MKLRDDAGGVLMSAALAAIAGCAGTTVPVEQVQARPLDQTAASDFPVLIGPPYTIGQTRYTPSDVMSYDAVGSAGVSDEGGDRISGAHHTLPVPSYVEVTALNSGRTILLRIERRGPMDSNVLIGLSPGAAAQLGISGNAPVRVRRVNPPEAEREMLRSGASAPERMVTPRALLAVLMRKLQQGRNGTEGSVGLNPSSIAGTGQFLSRDAFPSEPGPASPPVPASVRAPASARPPASTRVPASARAPAPPPLPPPAPVSSGPPASASPDAAPPPPPAPSRPEVVRGKAASGAAVIIQLGAFVEKTNAEALAYETHATISRSDNFWLVRKGPYATRAAGEAELEKLKASGYSVATILPVD